MAMSSVFLPQDQVDELGMILALAYPRELIEKPLRQKLDQAARRYAVIFSWSIPTHTFNKQEVRQICDSFVKCVTGLRCGFKDKHTLSSEQKKFTDTQEECYFQILQKAALDLFFFKNEKKDADYVAEYFDDYKKDCESICYHHIMWMRSELKKQFA